MPAVIKETIPLHELSIWVMQHREDGYVKGSFQIFPDNKKFVTVKAWRKMKNPVGRPRKQDLPLTAPVPTV